MSSYPSSMLMAGESSADRLMATHGMERVPSTLLDLFWKRGFLSSELCRGLIALIDAKHHPSILADDDGDAAFRTSETCDLQAGEPTVQRLEEMLAKLSGIDAAHGEPLQGQRYEVGQEFKAHTDYFTPGGADYERFCAKAGQRTWTFMIYLNDVEAGGETCFEAIRTTFQPERGKLVCWNNRLPDGAVNPDTLHHGMKVREGAKYVITKWYRERRWC